MGVIISCNWGPLDKLMRLSGIAWGAAPESEARFLSAAPVRTLGLEPWRGEGAPVPSSWAPGSFQEGAPGMGCFLRETDTPAI